MIPRLPSIIKALTAPLTALALAVLLTACRTAPQPTASNSAVPPELLQQPYLLEVIRYLYHWHLDEPELELLESEPQLVVWVHKLQPKLDPGDHSLEAEILLPQFQLTAKVKKEDYTIQELGAVDKTSNFRVVRITEDQVPPRPARDWAIVHLDTTVVRDYLFSTRDQHDYADAALIAHLRQALHLEASTRGILATNTLTGNQVVHLAPLSPVANDTWVLWEAGRKLFYIASDMDLSNPAVWSHEALSIQIFDLDDQVVASHEEAPASNRFLTRDQISRALFNCIVLGQRLVVPF